MLLLLHVVLTPIMMSCIISSKVLAALYTFVPICGMFSLNYIAMELENPFGTDANDLPMEHFQVEMNQCLLMLLHDNTDLIAWTSPRCITNFDDLLRQMQANRLAGKVRRLSDFGSPDSDDDGSAENAAVSQQTSINTSPDT